MLPTYELCKLLAARGKLTAEMLDIFLANGRLTQEQYEELLGLLN